jgi:small conductance mechanosensitive channel
MINTESIATTLATIVTTYGLRAMGAVVVMIVGWLLSRMAYRMIRRLCNRTTQIDKTLVLFLADAARYAVLIFTIVAVLTTFGIATTSFVAVVGAMGLAIGLALQGTLSHFAAGIMLIIFRPFHVGDTVETGGVTGVISIVNVFYTELESEHGRIVVPNGKLWGEIVKVPRISPAQ